MIDGCPGCEDEWSEMIYWLKEGLHFAGKDVDGEHFAILMIDDKGEVVVE